MLTTICLYVCLTSTLGLGLIGIFYCDAEPMGGTA